MQLEETINTVSQEVTNTKPRMFDIYILPAFLVWYAIASKGMKNNARRILCTSGILLGFRNFTAYQALIKGTPDVTDTSAT